MTFNVTIALKSALSTGVRRDMPIGLCHIVLKGLSCQAGARGGTKGVRWVKGVTAVSSCPSGLLPWYAHSTSHNNTRRPSPSPLNTAGRDWLLLKLTLPLQCPNLNAVLTTPCWERAGGEIKGTYILFCYLKAMHAWCLAVRTWMSLIEASTIVDAA